MNLGFHSKSFNNKLFSQVNLFQNIFPGGITQYFPFGDSYWALLIELFISVHLAIAIYLDSYFQTCIQVYEFYLEGYFFLGCFCFVVCIMGTKCFPTFSFKERHIKKQILFCAFCFWEIGDTLSPVNDSK